MPKDEIKIYEDYLDFQTDLDNGEINPVDIQKVVVFLKRG